MQLRISGIHYEMLKNHLFPPDGNEAVAVALCGRYMDSECTMLLIHDLTLIPYDECLSRKADYLNWSTASIHKYFEKICNSDMAIIKIHSHPNGLNKFSALDDASDIEFFSSVFGWSINEKPHGSVVMLPDGRLFGRLFYSDLHNEKIERFIVSGDKIEVFSELKESLSIGFAERTIQAFGEATYLKMNNFRVGVVGCSGTGSIVIEQLVRLGVGKLLLIDPDVIEEKNLNRILNSTNEDAKKNKTKVTAIRDAIIRIGLGTIVDVFEDNLYDSVEALKSLLKCDVIFGCLDSVDGRYLLNQLSTFYLIPYIDLGVKLEADGLGGINQICGSVHYIQPGKSSLLTRGVYTIDDVTASSQFRKNPEEYELLKKNAYIKNVNVNNPAVISINMLIASHAVNEFLNRVHPYKVNNPEDYASSTIDITEGYIINANEQNMPDDVYLKRKIGLGDVTPFIEMPELTI
jgi:hypothetical protein